MTTLSYIAKTRTFKFALALQHMLSFLDTEGEVLDQRIRASRMFLIAGNGGSMCDALHFAEELTGRYRRNCTPFPAFVLGANVGHVTCVANDYGFDEVFIRELKAHAQTGVVPFVIYMSTSGTSPSITKLREYCADIGFFSLFLTSSKFEGEALTPRELVFKVQAKDSDVIQEIHMNLLHSICELVSEKMTVAL